MEIRIMRKHLIGTILVLAALAACNKEVETPAPVVDNGQEEVTPGKVTLTFKAAIDDGTRTVYANDKTASWQADDAISVCLSDGTNYEVVDFTTTDGIEFSAEVTQGYEIVSGVYPANDVYSTSQDDYFYSNGTVKAVYLPDTYNLGTANDGGIALPMVGQMDDDDNDGIPTFKFHHICGALKIEVVDIFNALTFTTAGEKIAGLFSLNSDGHIALETAAETATDNVTFNYGRLSTNPAEGERLNRTFYIPVPDGTLTAGATMALKKRNNNTLTTVYEKETPQPISFSNKIMRLSAINLQTPEGWTISVTEGSSSSETGKYIFTVPSGTKYVYTALSKSSFESDYQGSVAAFIEGKALTNTIYTTSGSKAMKYTMDYYYGKEYIILICGVTNEDGNRRITFNYCLLDYQFPTEDYLKWIGQWSVNDGDNTDTWSITRKEANKTYNVTGLCGNTNKPKKVEALYNEGNLKFMSQYDFATANYNDGTYLVSLIGYVNNTTTSLYNSYNEYDLMEASLTDNNAASLSGFEFTYSGNTFTFSKYNLSRKLDHQSTPKAYGTARKLPATMTRVATTE